MILGLFAALFAGFIISACNSNPPVIAAKNVGGTLPTFTSTSTSTSTPCSGVFGNNTVGNATTSSTDLFYYPVVPGSATTLTILSTYTASAGAVTFESGIYSNNAGSPGSLLAETGSQTVSAAATLWNTVPLNHSVNLSSGVTYWLAYQANPATSVPDQNVGVVAYAYQPAGAFGSLSANFTGGTLSSGYIFSLYGTTCP